MIGKMVTDAVCPTTIRLWRDRDATSHPESSGAIDMPAGRLPRDAAAAGAMPLRAMPRRHHMPLAMPAAMAPAACRHARPSPVPLKKFTLIFSPTCRRLLREHQLFFDAPLSPEAAAAFRDGASAKAMPMLRQDAFSSAPRRRVNHCPRY
jgi:hypothetical protein